MRLLIAIALGVVTFAAGMALYWVLKNAGVHEAITYPLLFITGMASSITARFVYECIEEAE